MREYRKGDIFGKLHELFSVKDPKFLTALNDIVGFKLFYLVVKDEWVCASLCKNENVRGDFNIIPNNRIWSKLNTIEKVS